ncbi:ATP synthase subunit C [Sedimentibacter sp. MB31-C6]|uniref:ATP synthase subunit C n=1 Tax=Sedimentibacter sp. MB31-C6 TaxID=3109366 RepID=UPI002DDDAE47|nr:ATP synthase subunit C [Sedimentibacter sp. MB36-C1]WSI04120.1 ATP synthase subunit C [Sedimentibacter sp. MB36-C1]
MQIILILLAASIAVGTIIYGYKAMKNGKKGSIKKAILTTVSAFGLVMVGAIISTIFGGNVFAETEAVASEAVAAGSSLGDGLKYFSAALSTGIATIGTGLAVGSVGSSAVGAISEDSSILGKTLIFVGMAEGIAIYGMIISILILFV